MAFNAVNISQPTTVHQRCPTELLRMDVKETTAGKENLFTRLPNDILVEIISLLDMKPAIRTSVLSSTFENLWTYYSGSLIFDDEVFLSRLKEKILHVLVEDDSVYEHEEEKLWYLNWVNHVVSRHKASTIEEFRVKFNLRLSDSHHIDRWLDFALQKSDIKIFHLDLNPLPCHFLDEEDHYCFPNKYLDIISSNSKASPFGLLTLFSTNFVNVPGEFIEMLLSRCQLLEKLCIEESEDLIDLTIRGSSLKLKHLEIVSCLNMETLEICEAPQLEFFKYYGVEIELFVGKVPRLREVHASAPKRRDNLKFIFDSLSQYLPQLTVLRVAIVLRSECESWDLPIMNNLKELHMDAYTLYEDEAIFSTEMFFEAAPNLQKFTFVLGSWDSDDPRFDRDFEEPCLENFIRKLNKLEELKFSGFRGYKIDSELLWFCLKYAPKVKKLVIDRQKPLYLRLPSKVEDTMANSKAEHRALELKENLPPNVKFILL